MKVIFICNIILENLTDSIQRVITGVPKISEMAKQ